MREPEPTLTFSSGRTHTTIDHTLHGQPSLLLERQRQGPSRPLKPDLAHTLYCQMVATQANGSWRLVYASIMRLGGGKIWRKGPNMYVSWPLLYLTHADSPCPMRIM